MSPPMVPTGAPNASQDRSRSYPWGRLWIRDSTVLLASQGINTLMTSLVAILIARSLAPEAWGLFSALLGLAVSLAFLIDFGLTPWLLRELSSEVHAADASRGYVSHRASQQLTHSLSLYLTIGVLVLLGALITYSVFAQGPQEPLILLVALVLYMTLQSIASGLETVLRARRELGRLVLALVIEKLTLLTLVVGVLALGTGLVGLGLAYALAGVVRLSIDVGTVLVSRRARLVRPRLRGILLIFRRAFPFAINRASMQFAPSLDVPLLALISIIMAGSYALGYRIVSMLLIIPAIGGTVLYPILAEHRGRSTSITFKAGAYLGIVGIVLAGVGIPLAPRLVPAVFGSDHAQSIGAIQVMLLCLPFTFASGGLLPGLYTQGLERQVALVSVGSSAFGTVVVLLGGMYFGAAGSGAGFVARQALLVSAFLALLLRYAGPKGEVRRTAREAPSSESGASLSP